MEAKKWKNSKKDLGVEGLIAVLVK